MEILRKIKGENYNLDTYEVRCQCGKIFYPRANNVDSGKTKSCGKGTCHGHFKDLTGEKYNFLTVKEFNEKTGKWKVECVCGNIKESSSYTITSGKTKSCGCMSGKIWSDKSNKGVDSLWVSLYNSYKSGAKNRGYSFELSVEQFKEGCSKECHYCGRVGATTRNRNSKHKEVSLSYNGLDRFDNSKGYELSNVVTCCSDCNYAKGQKSFNEFEAWLSHVIKNNEKTKLFNL